MRRATLFRITREGWYVLVPLIVLVIVFHIIWGWWAAVPVIVLALLVIPFVRDYPCQTAAGPLAIIAPADGTVVHRREGYDPFLDREAIKISIHVNLLGAYYLRAPVEGQLLELDTGDPGTPTKLASWLRTDVGDDIVFAVTKGNLFGLRPCLGNYGIRVGQGRCCGLRRLARSIDIYLPQHARVLVEPDEPVRAGSSVLANLVNKSA